MAKARPEIPMGYLGAQPKCSELNMRPMSHENTEISLPQNEVEIKFKTPKKLKVTTNLLGENDKEHSEFVFTQTKDGVLSFVITFPASGYFKFQIFALEANDENQSLPNVFNYLINVKDATKPAYSYPKQYAQWKDGCYLYSPLVLNAKSSLTKVHFKVFVPNAKAVAIVCAGEWYHMTRKGENWEVEADLHKHRGKDVKVTVNANFGEDETKYATLLEYMI